MYSYIKNLQTKTENTRKQILVGSLIVSMSFVFLIWVTTFGQKSEAKIAKETQEQKPFSLLSSSFSETYNNISASVGNISKNTKEKKKNEKVIELIPVEYQ
jgi:lipopolysaccharide export LptBFGC system permease protein LptF